MRPCLLIAVGLLATAQAAAAELQVNVTGIRSATGQVGCALYASERGFPMEPAVAAQRWLPADPAGVQCRFEALAPGVYAVAVSHDLNGNRRTDTNLVGLPTEDWGVSNNIRPSLRAPRFEEAAVQVAAEPLRIIEVRLGR